MKKALLLMFTLLFVANSAITSIVVEGLKTTNSLFKVTVSYSAESKITLTSTKTFLGTKEKSGGTGTGTVIFEDLRVVESDDIVFTATGISGDDLSSSSTFVEEAKLILSATISVSNVRKGIPFTLTIDATDQFNGKWIEDVELSISDSFNNFEGVASSGKYSKEITYNSEGDFTIKVEATGADTLTKTVKVTAAVMKVNFYSSGSFSTSVSNLQVLLDSGASGSVMVQLHCVENCSGNKFKKYQTNELIESWTQNIIESGYYQNIQIVSSGKFQWRASSAKYGESFSDEFIITNTAKSIVGNFTKSSITAHFPVKFTIYIFGEDNELYLGDVNVKIVDESKASSLSEDEFTVSDGKERFEIYYKKKASKAYYSITSDILDDTNSETIEVHPSKIVIITTEDWLPSNTKQSFLFDIQIMDHGETTIESEFGKYNLTMSLDPDDSDFDGSQSKVTTSKGEVTIDDLIIESSGDYKLLISCTSCETYTTEKFSIDSTACRLGSGPVSCMCVLIFLGIISSIAFYLSDKNTEGFQPNRFSGCTYNFFLIHPFLALFFRQPRKRRILVSIQLFTSELLMLTLIGAIYAYYDSPTERYEKSFTDYYGRQLYKGGTGWALAQFGIIPIFYLNFYSLGYRDLTKYTVISCIVLSVLSFGAIVGMTIKYCIGYSVYWTVNFLIFVLFDLCLMQIIYTALAICLMPNQVKMALRPERESIEATGEIRDHNALKIKKRKTGVEDEDSDKQDDN